MIIHTKNMRKLTKEKTPTESNGYKQYIISVAADKITYFFLKKSTRVSQSNENIDYD